jgi:hypothetical protein
MTDTTTASFGNPHFKKGELIEHFKAQGREVTKTLIRIDELMPQLTCEELKKLKHWMTFEILADSDTSSEARRELLNEFDRCPCCEQWLGHNKPPASVKD